MKQKTLRVCFNRGNLRLWIEGQFLLDCGFAHGDRYDLIDTGDGIYAIRKKDDGARKIAGKPDRPIIDINSTKTLEHLGQAGELIELTSRRAGHITIQRKAT